MNEMSAEELYEDVELSKALSEAEKIAHEAREAELRAQKLELELLEQQINMDYQLGGIYTFTRAITQKSVNRLCKHMRVWHKNSPEGPWTIYLNSVGGTIVSGVALMDELRAHSRRGGGTHHITIKVRGEAASMAGILLQVADHRVMGPGAQLMIHEPRGWVEGSVHDIEAEYRWLERWWNQAVELFVERGARLSAADIKKWAHKTDWWLSAREAVDLGFADSIG